MGTADQLRQAFNCFKKRHTFAVDQLVKWKAKCKNRREPKYDEPAIVCEVLTEPIVDEEKKSAGSAYFREPLDIVLGLMDPDDGSFVLYHFDSRRFEPYED